MPKCRVALVSLPSNSWLAKFSRLPLVSRLLRARLEFAPDALVIHWRFGERLIPYREIARTDWQLDGVLLLFHGGRRLLLPTARPPNFSGSSGRRPELRHAVQLATFAARRHNQDVAERIQSETERAGSW